MVKLKTAACDEVEPRVTSMIVIILQLPCVCLELLLEYLAAEGNGMTEVDSDAVSTTNE